MYKLKNQTPAILPQNLKQDYPKMYNKANMTAAAEKEYCFWNVKQTSDIYGTKEFFLQEIKETHGAHSELEILQEIQHWVVLYDLEVYQEPGEFPRPEYVIDKNKKIIYNAEKDEIEFINFETFGIIS